MTEITDDKTTPVVDELDIIDRLFGWNLEHVPQWAKRRAYVRILRRGSREAREDVL